MREASASTRSIVASMIAASLLGWVAAPRPASAVLRTFELTWTSGSSAAARGTLTLDDAICNNPGDNSLTSGPGDCFADLSFEITGAASGNGRFSLGNLEELLMNTAVTLDFDLELIAQGPVDVNVFAMPPAPDGVEPFIMRPAGSDGTDDLTLVSMAPVALPFASDTQKCADAIGKAGAAYFSARTKALEACRSALTKGKALFQDKAKTSPVQTLGDCPDEYKAGSKIDKARQKARKTLEKKCTDPILAALPTCGDSLDALADASGATGCLIESVDRSVGDLFFAESGF
jgi:hypothetical protein